MIDRTTGRDVNWGFIYRRGLASLSVLFGPGGLYQIKMKTTSPPRTFVEIGAECCEDTEAKENGESEEHHRIQSYPCCVHRAAVERGRDCE